MKSLDNDIIIAMLVSTFMILCIMAFTSLAALIIESTSHDWLNEEPVEMSEPTIGAEPDHSYEEWLEEEAYRKAFNINECHD